MVVTTKTRVMAELKKRYELAPKKIRRNIIVPYQHTHKWEEMPEWLKTKRKVDKPSVYVRTHLKETLPFDDVYEADQ